jgi:hypothetical protein
MMCLQYQPCTEDQEIYGVGSCKNIYFNFKYQSESEPACNKKKVRCHAGGRRRRYMVSGIIIVVLLVTGLETNPGQTVEQDKNNQILSHLKN